MTRVVVAADAVGDRCRIQSRLGIVTRRIHDEPAVLAGDAAVETVRGMAAEIEAAVFRGAALRRGALALDALPRITRFQRNPHVAVPNESAATGRDPGSAIERAAYLLTCRDSRVTGFVPRVAHRREPRRVPVEHRQGDDEHECRRREGRAPRHRRKGHGDHSTRRSTVRQVTDPRLMVFYCSCAPCEDLLFFLLTHA